ARELVGPRVVRRHAELRRAHRRVDLAPRLARARDRDHVGRARLDRRDPRAQPVHDVARRHVRARSARGVVEPRASILHAAVIRSVPVAKGESFTFKATIGRTWVLYTVDVPDEVSRAIGEGKHAVEFTLNGSSPRKTTLAPKSGG